MKKIISREHADHLKWMYTKAEFDRSWALGIQNRQAALCDILFGYQKLQKESYDALCNGVSCCND